MSNPGYNATPTVPSQSYGKARRCYVDIALVYCHNSASLPIRQVGVMLVRHARWVGRLRVSLVCQKAGLQDMASTIGA